MANAYKKTLVCLLCFVYYGLAYGQVNVSGVVKGSDDGKSLPQVSVIVKGTGNGTVTDLNGGFHLSVSPNAVLQFSFIGYVPKNVEVKGRSVIDVTLQASKKDLEDVVVVGYHEVSKKTTTAAITIISGKDIEDLPTPSFDQALQGKVPGVNIQNYNGQPGVRNTFVVRGNTNISTGFNEANALSTPLFIIDGVPTNLSDMSQFDNTQTDVLAGININDIESIEVQKDAAATAIWGSRGANGVVVVTTKKAKKGKPQIELNVYGGFSPQPKLAQTATGSEERNEKIDFIAQQTNKSGIAGLPQMLTDSLNPSFNNATNWQGLLYRKAYLHNVDLSIAGASDNLNYRVSMNNYNQDGVLYGTGLNRYSFRSNIDYQVTKKFGIEVNISMSRVDRQPGLSNSIHSVNPLAGYSLPSSFYYLDADDIAAYKGQYSGIRNLDRNDNITAFVGLHYQILPGLSFKSEESINKQSNENQFSAPSNLSSTGAAVASDSLSNYTQVNANNILSYNKKLGNSNISILAFQSFERDVTNLLYVSGQYVPDNSIEVVQGVSAGNLSASTNYLASSLLSWGGQAHYDYKQKYLLDATLRADASSRFGPGSKWGYFPSVSAGYNIMDEDFMKRIKWIDQFKIRGSWGISGQQPTNYYAPYNTYVVGTGNNNFNGNGSTLTGYYNGVPIGIPNFSSGTAFTDSKLSWEPTKQLDLGFDASFLNSRIQLTVDYYDKRSSNQYYTFPLPFYTGYTQQTTNSPLTVGNRGIEINLNTRNLSPQSKVQWNTNFNISYNHNEILKLPNGNRTLVYTDPNTQQEYVFTVGKPINVYYQIQYQGVYNTQGQVPVNPLTGQLLTYFKGYYPVRPGYPVWKDINGDYDVWTDEDTGNQYGDLQPTGNPNPSVTGGFNNTVSYKGFTVSVNTSFTLGRTIVNTLQQQQLDNWGSGLYNFVNTGIPNLNQLGFWNPAAAAANPNGYKAKFPALNPNGPYFYEYSPWTTMFNENGSYFKINTISLGYRLPKKFTDALGVSSCRLYFTADNIAVFQKATVPDAEQVTPFGDYDGTTYPIPKDYTLGINVQF
ncbi:SusC/RagA family TonB-linked outer membrane protein [Mucilaginibacter sp. X5P1]|uniref:SusC/RagA family TonB-linked outer membrane protein n=1 Tax=Mucilaginibacter sp. X5P1 TaxID=2723088 RepID=UPI001608670B|nr:SusC/RagA family TonB-linked outer membrane protein [Mucilaginibacter sp. X5P1]MBB6136625.1 TonB-linked SusC/RagA family outer membrane protein [Mucilaginibacter sp. X5P1]